MFRKNVLSPPSCWKNRTIACKSACFLRTYCCFFFCLSYSSTLRNVGEYLLYCEMFHPIQDRNILHNHRRENFISNITLVMSSTVMNYLYFNGFDQRIARQQLCKHGPTRNSRGGCVFRVCGDVTQRWLVCFLWCVSVPRVYKWQNSFGSGTSQFSVGDSHGKFVEVSLWRFNVWFEDFMCAVVQWYCELWFSETVIVPVL
jgi:hypothetical protein